MVYTSAQAVEESDGALGPVIEQATSDFRWVDAGIDRNFDFSQGAEAPPPLTADEQFWLAARYGFQFLLVHIQGYFILLISSIVGAGLIAKDLRSNALEIYLTKPITPVDYVVGKLAVIFVFITLVTFVPALLVYLTAVAVWPGFLGATWPILFRMAGFCLLASLVNGIVILGLSSLAKSARFATVIWFALAFISAWVGLILSSLTKSRLMSLVSWRENFNTLAGWFFSTRPWTHLVDDIRYKDESAPIAGVAVLVLAACVAGSALVMSRSLRNLENR
jgi:ABC-type transport system involved in multi-copper enzyme maturation permease subunit